MKYNVEVLKAMIENRTQNIESFMSLLHSEIKVAEFPHLAERNENTLSRVADMVTERRNLAALVENDGILDDNMVQPDIMSYSAHAGADTSWW